MVAMATTAKAEQVAPMVWALNSEGATPAAMVAMATAAKTTARVWVPTSGPLRKSRVASAAFAQPLLQLRPVKGPETHYPGDREPAEAMLGIDP